MRILHLSLLVLCFSVLLTGCSTIPFLAKSPQDKFDEFVKEYFDGKLSPQNQGNDRIGWLRAHADVERAASASAALRRLRQIDTTGLTVDERIDWLQLEAALKRTVFDTSLSEARRIPGRYVTVGGIYWKVMGGRAPSVADWNEILTTLRTAPEALAIGRAQLRHPPLLWINLAANTVERFEKFLGETLIDSIAALAPDTLRMGLLGATDTAVMALSGFRRYLRDTLEACPDNCWSVGSEYYDWLLRNVHFLPYTAETMIETGWRIHRETNEQLREIARRIDPMKTVQEVIADMKTRHPEPYKITDAYRRESDRARELILSKNMVAIPSAETLLFVPTPLNLRETYAWAGYGGIDRRDNIDQGRFFVTDIVPEMTPEQVAEKLRAQNTGWVTVIALHEGYPGHHLQTVYAKRSHRPVRSRMANTYYGEGWALYAESWMGREGYYLDADDSLAWLQMRLWRTARVIVDPSIHTGRMTYEQAVQFMVDEVGLERSAAEAEVNRYTTWPTQAPSYIIGWLEIEKLKEELQIRYGETFTEKRFVETLLSVGSLPLELMKRAVRDRHENQRAAIVPLEIPE